MKGGRASNFNSLAKCTALSDDVGTCDHLRCWTLGFVTWKQGTYELCLSISIQAWILQCDMHLLFMIQVLLETAWLHARHLPPAYRNVSSRILKQSFMNQSRTIVWNNTVSSPWSLRASKQSWKVYVSLLHCEWLAVKFIWAFLAGYTSSHELISISIHKELQSC